MKNLKQVLLLCPYTRFKGIKKTYSPEIDSLDEGKKQGSGTLVVRMDGVIV